MELIDRRVSELSMAYAKDSNDSQTSVASQSSVLVLITSDREIDLQAPVLEGD